MDFNITPETAYTDENVKTLAWNVHIRERSGMYIGKKGDGSSPDDGLYVLIKEVIDNSVDEFAMGCGKLIKIELTEDSVSVRDFGRGIPLGSVIDVASKMNTGAKYDTKAFVKSVGLNGVGIKAVNAMSSSFYIQSFRDGKSKFGRFSEGNLLEEGECDTTEKNGTLVKFTPDATLFQGYKFNTEFVEQMLKHYTYLNIGLKISFNGQDFISRNGLLDLLNDTLTEEPLYPPIYLKGDDIEIVMSHNNNNGENIFSYANGQNTTQGGTHLSAFREAVAKTLKDFYKKDFDPADVRQSIIGAISLRLIEPEFGNQTKTLLASKEIEKGGKSVRSFILDFVQENLSNYLYKNTSVADVILKKIQASERERKEINDIRKGAKARAQKSILNNPKLRDCRFHYHDKSQYGEESQIFITEGDSASGSITKSRNPNTQAVFSLKGKPFNSYGASVKKVFENKELQLLHDALGIGEDLENLRYNKVIIATDADSDGMHIRMLVLTFFLIFCPDMVRQGHVYILQTPLFRVRNKQQTLYCYTENERDDALSKIKSAEITRFKGLGEISPDEFKGFIGEDIHLDKVHLETDDRLEDILKFYMSDNTPGRRKFIEDNLRLIVQ